MFRRSEEQVRPAVDLSSLREKQAALIQHRHRQSSNVASAAGVASSGVASPGGGRFVVGGMPQHRRPSDFVMYMSSEEKHSHKTKEEHLAAQKENFGRFFRFGVVDSSLLLISILAGFSLDAVVAKRIGVRGYGPIVGAGVGNLIADTIAGLPEGRYAAAGVSCGAAASLIPVILVMATRKPLEGRQAVFVGSVSAVMFAGTFIYSYIRPDDNCEE